MKIRGLAHQWFGSSMALLLCGLLLLTRAGAATVLSGNVSGTWTTNGSPYILSADCTVASNQTLTIHAGATVIILPEVSLLVRGQIHAIGTPEQPVTIRGPTATNYWASIQMNYSGATNRFRYCRISEGYDALSFSVLGGGAVMVAEIVDCDFTNWIDSAIFGEATGATLAPEIHRCIFERGGNFACYFRPNYTPSFPQSAFVNPRITGNLFKNLLWALRLELSVGSSASAAVSRPVFINNTVTRCGVGVNAIPGANFLPAIRNNIFVDNETGVNSYFGTSSTGFDAMYNCFARNFWNFQGYPGAYGVPVITNHNGDSCDVFYNIFLDPQFLDTNQFLLSNLSPCVDAGDPAIADVCFDFSRGTAISDIGAYGGPDACGWITHGFAPVIAGALSDQSSCVGGSATFKVRVEGSEPLDYRWYFNGATLLAGETNAQLNLVNMETNQAGLYSVAVSNAFGSVTSAPARLLVFDACVGIHLYAGLSITGMVGRTYNVEYVTNLAATNWTVLASNRFTQPQWLYIDTNTPFDAKKFFRVRLVP